MLRHTVLKTRTDDDAPELTEQLVESILDQGHLCPLPPHVKPVYWELDYTLRLSPLPQLVSYSTCVIIKLFLIILYDSYHYCIIPMYTI